MHVIKQQMIAASLETSWWHLVMLCWVVMLIGFRSSFDWPLFRS